MLLSALMQPAATSALRKITVGDSNMVKQLPIIWRAIAPARWMGTGIMFALALFATPAQAEEPTAAATHSHFLWQIDSPTNTVYLLGSIHFLSAEHYPLPTVMQEAFEASEVVVFEADLGTEVTTEVSTLMLEKAQPEPGEALGEVLSETTYDLAASTAADMGLPMALFDPFEPWFYAISISSLQLINLGFAPSYGIDQHFYERAQTTGKSMLFLETVEQQLDFFDQLSIDEQRQFTQQTLDELDVIESSFQEMVSAWSAGDREDLSDILLTSFASYPQMQQIFLSDRNHAWIPQIQTFLQDDEDYLVIVGALHLVGPDNVIALLEQQGYTAEQL